MGDAQIPGVVQVSPEGSEVPLQPCLQCENWLLNEACPPLLNTLSAYEKWETDAPLQGDAAGGGKGLLANALWGNRSPEKGWRPDASGFNTGILG